MDQATSTTWVIAITQWIAFALYGATLVLIFRMGYFFFSNRESANWNTIKWRMGYPIIAFLTLGLALQYAPSWIIRQARLGMPAAITEARALAEDIAAALPPLPGGLGGDGDGNLDTLISPTPEQVGGGVPPEATETIPTPDVSTSVIYRVVAGDTLASIAARYHMDLQALRDLNPQVQGDLIHEGDTLTIHVGVTPTATEPAEETPEPTATAVPPTPTFTPTPMPTATPGEYDSWGDWEPGDPAPTPPVATPTPGGN